MRTRPTNVVALILVVTFAGQLVHRKWQSRWLPITGPTIGEPLPAVEMRLAGQRNVVASTDEFTSRNQCTLMVFFRPNCSVCSRMRTDWRERWAVSSDSIDAPIRTIWLTDHPEEATAPFTAGYHLGGIEFSTMVPSKKQSAELLGVYGTPTTFLLDRAGRLRVGVIGNQLPPADSARAACHKA